MWFSFCASAARASQRRTRLQSSQHVCARWRCHREGGPKAPRAPICILAADEKRQPAEAPDRIAISDDLQRARHRGPRPRCVLGTPGAQKLGSGAWASSARPPARLLLQMASKANAANSPPPTPGTSRTLIGGKRKAPADASSSGRSTRVRFSHVTIREVSVPNHDARRAREKLPHCSLRVNASTRPLCSSRRKCGAAVEFRLTTARHSAFRGICSRRGTSTSTSSKTSASRRAHQRTRTAARAASIPTCAARCS